MQLGSHSLKRDDADYMEYVEQKAIHELSCKTCNDGKYCNRKPVLTKRPPNRFERRIIKRQQRFE